MTKKVILYGIEEFNSFNWKLTEKEYRKYDYIGFVKFINNRLLEIYLYDKNKKQQFGMGDETAFVQDDLFIRVICSRMNTLNIKEIYVNESDWSLFSCVRNFFKDVFVVKMVGGGNL